MLLFVALRDLMRFFSRIGILLAKMHDITQAGWLAGRFGLMLSVV